MGDFTMRFGTRIDPAGGVDFRLWAPQAKSVDLNVTGRRPVTMTQSEDWFGVHDPAAKPGDHYQFRVDGGLLVPDPASRFQAGDIHGPSVICDPAGYSWKDAGWQGRPWEEAVIYELHVGCFTAGGTYEAILDRLDYLVELGITALELMPLAQFPGAFNWGYDGALLFAPCSVYGRPEELKALIDAAHQRGLMVFLDVVYNHFGPEGNYLYVYAREAFFTEQFATPWGAAINFCDSTVREFYIANALYWLEEFHLDGLRLDAVHSIYDNCRPDILEELAATVHAGPGSCRHIHLILENDDNCADYLVRKPDGQAHVFTAQWNDDFHHASHILATGETEAYYADYAESPINHLGRCLTEGFAYQGEASVFRDHGRRGQPSAHLPPQAFVAFLQNHDQIGNRALGERLNALTTPQDLNILIALLLLAPSPPLLFMGEEFAAANPFYYFCDFAGDLAQSVIAGRLQEFGRFAQFSSPESRRSIPDPTAEVTFISSKLDWRSVDTDNPSLRLYRHLLQLRREKIVPLLKNRRGNDAGRQVLAEKALTAWWTMDRDTILTVFFNLHDNPVEIGHQSAGIAEVVQSGRTLYQYYGRDNPGVTPTTLAPKSIIWLLGPHKETL